MNLLVNPPKQLTEITADGDLRYHFHPGQLEAWDAKERTIGVLAGTQGGKTTFGPPWLWREIIDRGPGDYIVATPTYPLLNLKALPEFMRLFGKAGLDLGKHNAQARTFRFSRAGEIATFGAAQTIPTQVFFGHANDPDSLEAATAKAAWMDEAGQAKFKLGSREALQRRLAIHQGRELITTTPYNLGWLKQQIWDKWQEGDKSIRVVRFDSTTNPAFPKAEFEKARASLPRWKFDLFYRAIFTRPPGLIYDSFDEKLHTCPRFTLPHWWPRFLGLDFGGVNTAGVFYAQDPNSRKLYAYREYHAGGRTAADHVKALMEGEPSIPQCAGGAKSEGQWRDEFAAAGLPVHAPAVSEVEVGIDRVYGAHKRGQIIVFKDLKEYLEEKATYSRKVDDKGDVLEEIEDKNSFHKMDAERYIVGWLVAPTEADEDTTFERAR